MNNPIHIFDIRIDPFSRLEFVKIIETNIIQGKRIIQNGINAATVNELVTNNSLRKAFNNSDLINIDGMSVVWALRLLGYTIPERVACPDLAMEVLKLAEKKSFTIFLLGSDEKTLVKTKNNLIKSFPNLLICGSRNGFYEFQDEEVIINMINKLQPDILFLGMPSPKKELFIENHKNELKVKYTLGVGGYFDILSGKTKRAPFWMQLYGLEWFYRFLQEPKRMWKRYMVGNLKFVQIVLKEKFKKRNAIRS